MWQTCIIEGVKMTTKDKEYNKTRTEKQLKVMQAYVDGKNIQVSRKNKKEWTDADFPLWDFIVFDYRVKTEPKYRPYKNTEEMIADYKTRFKINNPDYTMPLIWIQTCISHNAYLVNAFPKESDHIKVSDFCIYFERLLEDYTYLDGSPCGKLVEE